MKYTKYFLFQIRLYFFLLIQKIGALFGTDNGENMKSGELVVIGKNKVKIELPHKKHKKIIVEFIDDCEITPCNPKHHDSWCWELKSDHRYEHCYYLHINWHVSGVRTIRWTILY